MSWFVITHSGDRSLCLLAENGCLQWAVPEVSGVAPRGRTHGTRGCHRQEGRVATWISRQERQFKGPGLSHSHRWTLLDTLCTVDVFQQGLPLMDSCVSNI